jgi:hypothetical protein
MNSSSKAATCVVMATRAVPKAPQTLWSTETHCSPSLAGGPRCHPLQCPNSDASTPKAGMVSLGPRKMAGKTGPHQVGNSRKSPQYSTSNPPQNDPTSIGAKNPNLNHAGPTSTHLTTSSAPPDLTHTTSTGLITNPATVISSSADLGGSSKYYMRPMKTNVRVEKGSS